MRVSILPMNLSVHTATYRLSKAVRPSKRPSGRVVREFADIRLWMLREGDKPRRDSKLAIDNCVLPYMVINKAWSAHQDARLFSGCRGIGTRRADRKLARNHSPGNTSSSSWGNGSIKAVLVVDDTHHVDPDVYSTRHLLITAYFDRSSGSYFSVEKPIPSI